MICLTACSAVFVNWYTEHSSWAIAYQSQKNDTSTVDSNTRFVRITVYNPVLSQTLGDPNETANGSILTRDNVHESIAVSRDLEKDFPMGSLVCLRCNCQFNDYIFEVNDRMNKRFRNHIDIYSRTIKRGEWYGEIISYGPIQHGSSNKR